MSDVASNMPQPEPHHCVGPAAPDEGKTRSETRIDRAHVMSTGSATGPVDTVGEALATASDLDDSAGAAEGLRNQADELAAYLRSRMKDLDHRESLLNARSAQFDASLRNAQAALNERQAELSQREHDLAEREREVESRFKALSADANRPQLSSLERRAERLKRREAALAALRNDLDRVRAQALEMCIAAQNAFKQVSSGPDRAALSDSIGQVRDLSAEYYTSQNEELAQKKRTP